MRGPTGSGRSAARRQQVAAIGLAAAVGVGILVLYLLHPALSGYRFPIGPDGPVYTWLARLAAETGFVDAPGGGPGAPAVTLTLGSILGTEPVETVMLLGPVLAAASGLAAGALLEAALGQDRLRAVSGAVLTGAFTAYLAGGWLANVAMVAVFLVALAALARTASSRRSIWAGAALLAAAGLAHRIFVLIGAAILLVAAGRRLLAARRGSSPSEGASALRLGIAAIAGPAAALLVGGWLAAGPGVPGDTSQDGFFRRVGLRGLLLDRYRERLLGDAARTGIPIAAGLGLTYPWALGGDDGDGRRFLKGVLSSWALLSAAGIVVLAATGWGPPYRIIQFAFFLPVAAAAGMAILLRRSRTGAIAAGLLGVAFVSASMVGWFRQAPAFSAGEVAVSARAGAAASSLPAGTPLVFLVDTDEGAAAYHVSRAANVIRMGVPPERIVDVRVLVGQPRDLLAGRPTLTGDAEHDRMSQIYLREAAPLLERSATLVIRRFNPSGYTEAAEIGIVVADGVVALSRGEEMRGVGSGDLRPPAGLGVPALLLLSLGSLAGLGLLGWGWSRWILPHAGSHGSALAAPSVGLAVAIVAAVAADRARLLPGSAGALAVVASLGIAGYVLAARDPR
ncbi:MAG: hypothetical protein ACRDHM_02990 [Actinomycetota bacterium]